MTNLFLREIPLALKAGVNSGEYKLWGSAIRDVATGQFRGFLQETSGLGKLAGLAQGVPFSPVQASVDVAGFAVTGYQNEQIKAAIATVQTMQVAGLALSAAGIGVSVAGFAVLARKIDRVEAKVDAMGSALDRIAREVETLRLEPIRQDFTRLRTATKLLDEGWALPDPVPQWRAVAMDATGLADSFERRVGELLDGGVADPLTLEPFLEALALATAVRVSARLAAGEDAAAKRAAAEGGATLARFGDHVKLGEAVLAGIDPSVQGGTPEWQGALDAAADTLRPTVDAIRQREAAADSTIATLHELERQGIAGRAWLEAARDETEQQLLCLLPAAP